nr:MAG TPA: hypothetical protein [Caudoviricetes sp.]
MQFYFFYCIISFSVVVVNQKIFTWFILFYGLTFQLIYAKILLLQGKEVIP